MTHKVWVDVTVIPEAKAAHVEAFDNEDAAEKYAGYAEENAPENVTAWVQSTDTEIKSEFEP